MSAVPTSPRVEADAPGTGEPSTAAATAGAQDNTSGAGRRPDVPTAATATSYADAELERDLRAAIAHHRLDVQYQPIVRSVDGRLTGVEALLRWTDQDRGPVPPQDVVAIAEQSGLINDIGAWVLMRSCGDRTRWLHDYPSGSLDLAVNVSPHQLASPAFYGTVLNVLSRTRMDPTALILEVTETVFLQDTDEARDLLGKLKALGIRIALDDFGTGYSSLDYLHRVPVDIIKIDQGFITQMDTTSGGRAIVAAVTNLAHVLGCTVTAEGIVTTAHRNDVRALGCDHGQGYYYSRPRTSAQMDALLAAHSSIAVFLPTHDAQE